MTYKALMLDVDGTIIGKDSKSIPSPRVITAIQEAQKHIHVGLATSRPLHLLTHILDALTLTGPTIINGGSQIIDATSKKILWERPMLLPDILTVAQFLYEKTIPFLINDNDQDTQYSPSYKPLKPVDMLAYKLTNEQADALISELSHIPTITMHKITAGEKNRYYVHITHVQATKQTAILQLEKLLGIAPREVIGIGDGYNDFPLLMSCGLKVAMGNAVEDLKAIADFIAPSVTEDGVAHVIETFILPKN